MEETDKSEEEVVERPFLEGVEKQSQPEDGLLDIKEKGLELESLVSRIPMCDGSWMYSYPLWHGG